MSAYITCSFSKVRNDGGEGGDLLGVARVHALLRYAPGGHTPPSRGHPSAQARHPGQHRQARIGVARGEIATERHPIYVHAVLFVLIYLV
jgi:hypothetical protein